MSRIKNSSISDWKDINNQASTTSFNQGASTKQAWSGTTAAGSLSGPVKAILITVTIIGSSMVIFGVALGIYYGVTNGKNQICLAYE